VEFQGAYIFAEQWKSFDFQPFIEVFNYPLARYCSNGKTGVVVNGRELHHKDFEVLKQCGL